MSEQPREGAGLEGTPVCVSQDEVWFAENMVCLGIAFSLECSLMGMVWGFRKRERFFKKQTVRLPSCLCPCRGLGGCGRLCPPVGGGSLLGSHLLDRTAHRTVHRGPQGCQSTLGLECARQTIGGKTPVPTRPGPSEDPSSCVHSRL